jgi:TetR/AcrR family hemagglutinin/protease transcriptional regulator
VVEQGRELRGRVHEFLLALVETEAGGRAHRILGRQLEGNAHVAQPVEAVLGEVGRFIVDDALRPVQARPADAPQLLMDTALAFTEAVGSHPDYARVWLDWSTAFRGDVWPLYLEFQERVFAVLKPTVLRGKRDGSLAKNLDADEATRLLVGSAHRLA